MTDDAQHRLRVIKEANRNRYNFIEKELARIENKIHWMIGVAVTSVFIPILLKFL